MALSLPSIGQTPWGDELNAALGMLDYRDITTAGFDASGRLRLTREDGSIIDAGVAPPRITDAALAEQITTDGTLSQAAVEDIAASSVYTFAGIYVVPLPTGSMSDHTTYLVNHFAAAQALKVAKIIVPQLNSGYWQTTGPITLWAGIEVVGSRIKVASQNTFGFIIPDNVEGVKIHMTDLEGTKSVVEPGLPIGSPLLGAAGVACYGNNCVITGKYRNFRSGVSAGISASTSVDLTQRFHNTIDIQVEGNDFGLTYHRQNGSTFSVDGSYVRTLNSPDEPHLIYGTQARSTDCVIKRAVAHNSPEGVPVIVKSNEGLLIQSVSAYGTAGILEIVNPLGETVVDHLFGRDISTQGLTAEGATKLSGVLMSLTSQPWSGTPQPVRVKHLDVQVRAGMASGNLRIVTGNNGKMTLDYAEIEYNSDEVTTAQGIVTMFDSSDIGTLKIRNLGTGGALGVWYRDSTLQQTAKHVVRSEPEMNGVSHAFRVDADAQDIVGVLDYGRLRVINTPLLITGSAGRRAFSVQTVPLIVPANRWISFPGGPSLAGPTTTVDRELVYGIQVFQTIPADEIGVTVATAAASSQALVAIRSQLPNGAIGPVLKEFPPIPTTATGFQSVPLTQTHLILPGTYYLSVVVQGGAAVLAASAAPTMPIWAVTGVQAQENQIAYRNGVSGTIPTSFSENGYTRTSGYPRVAFHTLLS